MIRNHNGHVLTWVLGFLATISVIMIATSSVLDLVLGDSIRTNKNQLTLNIADAGVNYYLWHMSHDGADFQDGNTGGTPIASGEHTGFYGPYEHDYKDDNGDVVGKFTLYIKPKTAGSTVAVVRSVGETPDGKNRRTIEAELGAPSFASYGLIINGALYVGDTSVISGPIHSNVGIRMDGASDSDVTSAQASYVPPTNLGGNPPAVHNGVWCGEGTNCAQKNATNNNGTWRYPVTAVDFNSVSGELCSIKKKAFAAVAATASLATDPNACSQVSVSRTAAYIPRYQTSYSAQRGYLIELNTNGTYNLYGVASETYNYTSNTNYTSTYTAALNETLIASNIAIPEPNVIFVEDNIWVRTNPTFHGRVTVASARLTTADNTNVYIADDIKYSTKNGEDAIGLIAEGNVIFAPYAPPMPGASSSQYPFEINAALIAKEGNSGIGLSGNPLQGVYGSNNRQYPEWTNTSKRLSYYGSIAAKGIAAWASGTRGFAGRDTSYDYNLLYSPPPSFPITGTYDILKWREILVTP